MTGGPLQFLLLLIAGWVNRRQLDIIDYLKDHPTRQTLGKIIDMLDDPVADLVRKDKRFKELGLNPADYADKKAVVALLLEHPELMQRPIVIRGKRAIIARPPEKLEALLS